MPRTYVLAAALVLLFSGAAAVAETIDEAKLKTDGLPVSLAAKAVTYSGAGFFYVEEDSRCSGIRVEKSDHSLSVGMRSDIAGTIATKPSGERYIAASLTVQSAPPNAYATVSPLAMSLKAIGGAAWNVAGGGGQTGAAGAVGLNNVGLLVKVWGRFQQTGETSFTVDDGSGAPVRCEVPAGTVLQPGWQYVAATGISSLATSGPDRISVVLVRDIRVLLPAESVSPPGKPSGNTSPVVGASWTYSASASLCSHGHPVEYSFAWGDGTSSSWSTSANAAHSWSSPGTRTVTVTARCQANPLISATSPGLQVTAISSPYTGQMVLVSAGSFDMGTPDEYTAPHNADEHPRHSVAVSEFYIGKHEVTRGEFKQFILAGGYSNQTYWSSAGWSWKVSRGRTSPNYWTPVQDWGTGSWTQTDSHPVVGVSYYEAEAFCNWAGGHLPTEAQWEKAARWNGTYSSIYPWGDIWDPEKCNNWFDHNSAGGGYQRWQTAPVESYPGGVSPYGCMDMSGNLWEWCSDWYDAAYYSLTPPGGWIEPQGPTGGSTRVLRGGCWSGDYDSVQRSALRGSYEPGSGWTSFGFRVAR